MVRNAIQMMERIAELNDRVKSARYTDNQYMNAINEATEKIVTSRLDPIKTPQRYSFQSAQRVRDELVTLIPDPATGSLSSDIVPFPADYKYYALLYVNVGSKKVFCKPTNYNQEGEIQRDPFTAPNAEQLYFNEKASGLRVLHGNSTLGTYELWYVKNPAVVSIGKESNKKVTGATLTAASYIAYDESVFSGTTYYPGDVFTASATTLTSGTVILNSLLVNSDLTSSMQDEVCLLASAIMNGTTGDFNKEADLQNKIDRF